MTLKKLVRIAVNDFRLVFRDGSLKIFLLLPLLNLPVIAYGLPYVASMYEVVYSYISVILMFASMQGSIAFGFIYSMVLVDEKDTDVARIYGILPVSKFWFVVFRLIPPFLLATLATFLLLLVEPFFDLSTVAILVYSTLAGLAAPLMALCVTLIARNKIEAMTWQKLFNIPLFLPIMAFFVPASFAFVFAVSPTFWAYQGFELIVRGQPAWNYLVIGIVHSLILFYLLVGRMIKVHYR